MQPRTALEQGSRSARCSSSAAVSLAGAVAATKLDGWFGQQVSGLGLLPTVLLMAFVVGGLAELTPLALARSRQRLS